MKKNIFSLLFKLTTVICLFLVIVSCTNTYDDDIDPDKVTRTRSSGQLVDRLGLPSITSIKVTGDNFLITCTVGHPEEGFNHIQLGLSDKLDEYLLEDSYMVIDSNKITSNDIIFIIPVSTVISMHNFYFAVRHANINNNENIYGYWNPYGSKISIDEGHIVTSKPEALSIDIILTVYFPPMSNQFQPPLNIVGVDVLFEGFLLHQVESFTRQFDSSTRHVKIELPTPNSRITYRYRCLRGDINSWVYTGNWTCTNIISDGTFINTPLN